MKLQKSRERPENDCNFGENFMLLLEKVSRALYHASEGKVEKCPEVVQYFKINLLAQKLGRRAPLTFAPDNENYDILVYVLVQTMRFATILESSN
eukprot:snap_masked-scaffold_3-processed-gene-1.24-mRNA-1 protein AED:1.00 eAED:1.00 QI:0/-1/0/0/-1/1/1/0/94